MGNPPDHIMRYWPTSSSSARPTEKTQTDTSSPPYGDPQSSALIIDLAKQVGQLERKLLEHESVITDLETTVEAIRSKEESRVSINSKFSRILDAMFWVLVVPAVLFVLLCFLFIAATLFFDSVTNALDWFISVGVGGFVALSLGRYLWSVKGINSRLERVEEEVLLSKQSE